MQLAQPAAIAASPDGAWWFVAERRGRIWRIAARDEDAAAELVLDISSRVDASSAAIGLLAIAVHPHFARNGRLFASYTAPGGTRTTSRLSRFATYDGGRSFVHEHDLLELDQSSEYHVNTDLQFGPDGHLYAGFGDGGPLDDRQKNHARDPHSWKGKILRLDVDAREPYGIPADNPFAAGGGAPEVWALGLRNPWRFAFDRETGELWAGDVGDNRFEEIDSITRGGDYGWPAREGMRCTQTCARTPGIDPLVALPHPEVSSITFGVVYRGTALPGVRGDLIYADYASGAIWAVDPARGSSGGPPKPRMLANGGQAIVAFAEDADGEPLLVDHSGTLWRLTTGGDGPPDVPTLLSQTGCFGRGGAAAPGLIPYEINAAFWSDGSAKQRWFAIPDGTTIDVTHAGHLELPVGSVVAKEFSLGGQRVETRLLVRHADGEWAGYTYRWDATQRDARLVPSASKGVTSSSPRRWYYPHRGECSRCHQPAAGRTLGLELAQLDRTVAGVDQLAALQRIGVFSAPLPRFRALPAPDADASVPVETRARAWLHANCAYCHRPGGTGQGDMDLRFTTPLAAMGVCNVPPRGGTFGQANALLVAPGEPRRSMLLRRMRALGFIRMPPLGSLGVDPQGIALVERWIEQMRCPPELR